MQKALAGAKSEAASAPTGRSGVRVARPRGLLRLQRLHGNRFVQRLLKQTVLSRKCSCGGSCPSCSAGDHEELHRQAAGGTGPLEAPPVVHEALRSPGVPLDAHTRQFMEPRFGHDFSQVRIHTGGCAAKSAEAVNALAYTVGSNIVFASGQYQPLSAQGNRTLAHELAHVVQQGGAAGASPQALDVGAADSPLEREADRAASAVISGAPPLRLARAGTAIQRTVNAANVDCNPPAAADVPVVGADPLTTLRDADREAIRLLGVAHDSLEYSRDRVIAGDAPFYPTYGDRAGQGLHRIFLMDPGDPAIWTGKGPGTIWILMRRLEIVRNLLRSGNINYHCRNGGGNCGFGCGAPCCTAGAWAASCDGIFHNFLCDPFWGQNFHGRTSTVMHEPFHMSFGFIADAGRTGNAHCYNRLVFWLNGGDSPADRRGQCPLGPA